MSDIFENVTLTKAANVYFEGKVTSRTITFADGSTKTLGVMLPGEYEFGTSQKEVMTVVSGALTILLPSTDTWQIYTPSQSFEVEANTSFKVKVETETAYMCTYE